MTNHGTNGSRDHWMCKTTKRRRRSTIPLATSRRSRRHFLGIFRTDALATASRSSLNCMNLGHVWQSELYSERSKKSRAGMYPFKRSADQPRTHQFREQRSSYISSPIFRVFTHRGLISRLICHHLYVEPQQLIIDSITTLLST